MCVCIMSAASGYSAIQLSTVTDGMDSRRPRDIVDRSLETHLVCRGVDEEVKKDSIKRVCYSSSSISVQRDGRSRNYATSSAIPVLDIVPPLQSLPTPLPSDACYYAAIPMLGAPLQSSSSFSSSSSSSSLSQLITLQQAEGYWKLDPALAALLSSSLADLRGRCPVECSPAVELLWVTVLALSLMEERFPGQRDEWELVAMKAEMWLNSQPLPPATPSLDSFKQAAKSCVSM